MTTSLPDRGVRVMPWSSNGNGVMVTAALSGRLDLLIALRDKIAAEIDSGVPARDLAALSLRLITLTEEIASMEAKSTDDDIGTAAVTPDAAWPAA